MMWRLRRGVVRVLYRLAARVDCNLIHPEDAATQFDLEDIADAHRGR